MNKPQASPPPPPPPSHPPVEPDPVKDERDYEGSQHYDEQDRERVKSNKDDDEAAHRTHPKSGRHPSPC